MSFKRGSTVCCIANAQQLYIPVCVIMRSCDPLHVTGFTVSTGGLLTAELLRSCETGHRPNQTVKGNHQQLVSILGSDAKYISTAGG